MNTTSPRSPQDTPTAHDHRRRVRVCPWLFPEPIIPTKPWAIFLTEFAQAVLHHETLVEFVAQFPDEFPSLTSAPVVGVELDVTVLP